MKKGIIGLSIIFLSVLNLEAQYVPVPANSSISLNGTWKFNPSPQNKIFNSTSFQGSWKDIEVPGEWTMQGFDVKSGTRAAYQTRFSVPGEWIGKRVMLRFDAVYSDAIIWLNGKKAGTHIGGFNVFEADITSFLKRGLNILTVGVMSESIADTLSCGSQYAAHSLGGIPRKVTLFTVPDAYISDIVIRTDLDDNYVNAKLGLDISFNNAKEETCEADLVIDLLTAEGQVVATNSSKVRLLQNQKLTRKIVMDVLNPLKWNAEFPNLYNIRLRFSSLAGTEIIEKKIGFRELEVTGNQLFLNGTSIKLHGLDRHEVHPLKGRSLNMELWKKDALLYKAGNVNYIRTSHYPPPEEFINLCDSIGLYVELENPLVWIGHAANQKLASGEAWNRRLLPELVKTTRETIGFYRNHPGIIFWSLANESAWSENWQQVLEVADSLDPTRPKSFHDQAYGVYNNYGSISLPIANMHYPGPKGPEVADTFRRPLLFGEYCHLNTYNRQEIATDPGVRDAWIRGFFPMWENMYKSRGCLGGAIWSGIDDAFMLPDGRLVGYGEWGPIDGWRRLKPEYYHIKKTYCPVIIGNRQVSLSKNSEILLQVENRYDFTDLKDCRFEWEIANEKGTASIHLSPHNTGILRIKPLTGDIDGKILTLKIYSPSDLLIDESVVEIGTINHGNIPFVIASQEKMKMSEEKFFISISGKDVKWIFDKRLGKLSIATYNGDTVINGGADLMILPLHSEECKTEHSLNIPFINKKCTNWTLKTVNSRIVSDTIIISVEGSYKEADIIINYYFLNNGNLVADYNFAAKEAVDPRQIGLVFSVPGKSQKLSWYRKGFWSSYPAWHIGRTEGEAFPFPPNAFYINKLGIKPVGEWRFDANSLGINDFRSTKDNIYWAALTKPAGPGIIAVSDGKQSFRSWVDGEITNFLVADYSNGGGEMFFASHLEFERKPLKAGDKFNGKVRLEIVARK
jgi:beta-galactosidase